MLAANLMRLPPIDLLSLRQPDGLESAPRLVAQQIYGPWTRSCSHCFSASRQGSSTLRRNP